MLTIVLVGQAEYILFHHNFSHLFYNLNNMQNVCRLNQLPILNVIYVFCLLGKQMPLWDFSSRCSYNVYRLPLLAQPTFHVLLLEDQFA